MKTTIFSFLLILLTFSFAKSQNFVFRVLASNGSNLFKSTSSKDWSPIKRGIAFNSGDLVQVADRAYIGLIHNSGKTIELIDAGVFEIDDIAVNIESRKKGIGGKYTEFVMNSMDSDMLAEEQSVTTRGGDNAVHVFLPYTSEVLQTTQIFSWDDSGHEEQETYIVNVKGIFDDPLLTEEVDVHEYQLNLDHPSLKEESMLVITVSKKGDNSSTSNEYAIDRVSEDKSQTYLTELEEVGMSDDSSLDQLMLAMYYEENGLLVDAISSYHKAIKLSPEIVDFQDLYQAFKMRHKIH